MRSTLTPLALVAATSAVALGTLNQPASTKHQRDTRDASTHHARTTDAPAGDILSIYSAGLHEMLASPKDHALRDTLDLVRPRLVELAEMSGNMPDPERFIDLLWTALDSPLSLRLAATDPGEDAELPFALELTSSPDDPRALERTIATFLREQGDLRFRSIDGGREFDTPQGPGRLMLSEESVALSFGPPLPAPDHAWDVPEGYTPVLAIHADLRNAQPLMEMMLSQSPDADQARPMLEQTGLLGDNALVFDLVMAHNQSESIVRGIAHNLRSRAASIGLPRDISLDRAFLSLIPADATYVSAGAFDLGALDQMLDVPEIQDALAQVNDQFGIDIRADIIEQIGHRAAIYQSDTTGGGGMLSMVAILELNNARQFARAHRRLIDAFNDFASEQARGLADGMGSIEIRPRRADSVEFFTLTWPGLPVPVEVSWAIHGSHLILALSPRSLVSAMAQAGAPAASFADNPSLATLTGIEDVSEAHLLTLSYTDAPRFAVQGYSLVNLLCAGVSNALRTADGDDPGIPLPAYHEFMSGIEPNITVSRWDGEDFTIAGRADASFLVNLAGTSGAAMGPMALGTAAGAVLPALGRARDSALQVKAQVNVRQLVMSMMVYAADNRDRLPASIDDLVGYLGDESLLSSPLGACIDGTPDYAIRTDLGGTLMSRVMLPGETLAAIDRASVINGSEKVIVGFMDGHVDAISTWQLTELLTHEHNRGAFEAFALPDWLNPGF